MSPGQVMQKLNLTPASIRQIHLPAVQASPPGHGFADAKQLFAFPLSTQPADFALLPSFLPSSTKALIKLDDGNFFMAVLPSLTLTFCPEISS